MSTVRPETPPSTYWMVPCFGGAKRWRARATFSQRNALAHCACAFAVPTQRRGQTLAAFGGAYRNASTGRFAVIGSGCGAVVAARLERSCEPPQPTRSVATAATAISLAPITRQDAPTMQGETQAT